MNKLYYVAILLLLAGCSIFEMDTENQQTEASDTGGSFYATMEQRESFTRVFLNEEIHTRWNTNDLISIFGGTTLNKQYIFSGKDGDSAGPFMLNKNIHGTGTVIDCNYALYPYDENSEFINVEGDGNVLADYIKYTIPTTQTYQEKSFGESANVMVAATASVNDKNLIFRNVCGYLRILLYGENQTVKQILFQGNNNEVITGEAAITPVYGGYPSIDMKGDGKIITLDCSDGVKIGTTTESATEFWIVVPPITFDKGFTITIKDLSGNSQSYEIQENYTFKRNKYATLTREIAIKDLLLYTNLSTGGTANCYAISKAGNYKFKAVKGNSSTSVGTVSKVKVLWESFGTDVTPQVGDIIASAGYQDGYIYFSTPKTFANGNAVIAARNDNGTILWSWHIWSTEQGWNDQVYPHYYPSYLYAGGTMMDRNLGATSAGRGNVGALGLLYQWGRKDPFMGACSISKSTLAASTGIWSNVSGAKSVDYAVENPMTFISSDEWCNNSTNYEQRWTYSEKTMYDPCPVGYKVPDGGENGFWSASYATTIIRDVTNKGIQWRLDDGTIAWYPAAGYRVSNGSDMLNVGLRGLYWSSRPKSSDSSNKSSYCFALFADDGYTVPDGTMNRGYGLSVRCVRE